MFNLRNIFNKHQVDGVSKERCEIIAEYIIEERCTIRAAAYRFGICKSTVHVDVTRRLADVNRSLYERCREVILENKRTRHLRGGEATRQKYMRMQNR